MTLTNSQCIEVAEKVWGWIGEFWSEDAWELPRGKSWIGKIEDEVNSWQGFGRTVEAMAEKFSFNAICCGRPMVTFISTKNDDSFTGHGDTLIEATYLAALEALK